MPRLQLNAEDLAKVAVTSTAGRPDDRRSSPHRGALLAHLEAERARCGRVMAEHGVGEMLATLHPAIRWRSPYLDVDTVGAGGLPGGLPGHRRSEPIVLDGRSVVLMPSGPCPDVPRVLLSEGDANTPCVVTYPVLHHRDGAASPWVCEPPLHRRALATLLGRTRACALEAIADTCSTTELARRIGVSPATASHHTAALRQAGLIASRRIGGAKHHRLTALGVALLDVDKAEHDEVTPDPPVTAPAPT